MIVERPIRAVNPFSLALASQPQHFNGGIGYLRGLGLDLSSWANDATSLITDTGVDPSGDGLGYDPSTVNTGDFPTTNTSSSFSPGGLLTSVDTFVKWMWSGKAGTSGAPVPVQNQVNAAMNNISQAYYQLRSSGQLTVNLVQAYQDAFRKIINSFCAYANGLNTARGTAGCQTITQVGTRWIQDREPEKAGLPQGSAVSPIQITGPGTGTTGTLPGGSIFGTVSQSGIGWLGVIALAIYAFKSKRLF